MDFWTFTFTLHISHYHILLIWLPSTQLVCDTQSQVQSLTLFSLIILYFLRFSRALAGNLWIYGMKFWYASKCSVKIQTSFLFYNSQRESRSNLVKNKETYSKFSGDQTVLSKQTWLGTIQEIDIKGSNSGTSSAAGKVFKAITVGMEMGAFILQFVTWQVFR